MKLYTEEQLVNTIDSIRDYLKNYPEKFHESMVEKHIKNLAPLATKITPIELSTTPIFDRIRQWANDRQIIEQSDAKTQFLKLSEEVGELSQAIANNNDMECIDAIGDCVIVLTNLAAIKGFQIEDCIHYAYEQIEHRKGKLIDGVYIKE